LIVACACKLPATSAQDGSAAAGANAAAQQPASASDSAPTDSGSAAQQPATPALPSEIADPVKKWEKQFFGRAFSKQGIDQRLGRIEQLVFGMTDKGDTSQRLDKLKSALDKKGSGPAVPPGVAEFAPAQSAGDNSSRPADNRLPEAVTGDVGQTPTGNSQVAGGGNAASTGNGQNGDSGGTDAQPDMSLAVQPVLTNNPGATASKDPPPVPLPKRPAELSVSKSTFATALQPQRIIQNLNDAIRDNPKDSELMFQRAKAYIQEDNLQRALSDLCDAIMDQPNRSDFYLARAWVYHLMGNEVLSNMDLGQARFVDPVFPEKIDWAK
jgi:hypothetical protein